MGGTPKTSDVMFTIADLLERGEDGIHVIRMMDAPELISVNAMLLGGLWSTLTKFEILDEFIEVQRKTARELMEEGK